MTPRKRGGSPGIFSMLTAAREYRAGGPGPKATLLALMERMGLFDGEWCCWPTTAELAYDSEQSTGSVRRHLAGFEAQGLLERRLQGREGGGRNTTVLVLNEAVLRDGSPPANAHIARSTPDPNAQPEGVQRANGEFAPSIEHPGTTIGAQGAPPAGAPEPTLADTATALVRAWWDERKAAGNPVGQPFIACAKVVKTMLAQDVPANRIEYALRTAPVCSTGALEMAIQQRLSKPARSAPVDLARQMHERYRDQEAADAAQ